MSPAPRLQGTGILVEVRNRHVPVTPALRDRVTRRVAFALGRFADRITGVTVRLRLVSGPRGGRDVSAMVDVNLEPLPSVHAEDTASDPLVAVGHALALASRAAARAIHRGRSWNLDSIRSS